MTAERVPDTHEILNRELVLRIEYWADRLRETAPQKNQQDAAAATNELDNLLPYLGETCSFSGKAVYPNPDSSGPRAVSGFTHGEGVSLGFSYKDFAGNGEYAFYQMFAVSQDSASAHPVEVVTKYGFAFLSIDGSVVPHISVDAIFEPAPSDELTIDINTRVEEITTESDKLVRLFESRSFRKKSHDDQQQEVDKFIERCNRKYSVRELQIILASGRYCCRPKLTSTGVEYEYIGITGDEMQGTVFGFDSLEREKLKSRPIRRTEDLVNAAAGLCLVVSVDSVAGSAQLRPTDVLFVSTADQKDLEVLFLSSDQRPVSITNLNGISSEGDGSVGV